VFANKDIRNWKTFTQDKKCSKMEFSVLIPVYYKENAYFFKLALESIWDCQTVKPFEVVIVRDGPLTSDLDKIIDDFSLKAPVVIVDLPVNKGLGIALERGVLACGCDLIARMDSDDIARSDRFEQQLAFFKEHPGVDLVGSSIEEFHSEVGDLMSRRVLPEKSKQIELFSRRRNPCNHMSVMFRKEAVLKAGNYQECRGYEDYYLWSRMILNGCKFHNLQENLIYARIGNGMLSRRQGLVFFTEEIKFQKALHSIGFLSSWQYVTNLMIRAIPHLFPLWALSLVYKFLRK
jgi:glycosyltransferase involved in cell wall biosynthesis